MTIAELQRRVEVLEAEVRMLRGLASGSPLGDPRFAIFPGVPEDKAVPGFGSVGGLADDPDFEEFTRRVREERERANRESLEEFDREREAERQAEAKKKRSKRVPKAAGR